MVENYLLLVYFLLSRICFRILQKIDCCKNICHHYHTTMQIIRSSPQKKKNKQRNQQQNLPIPHNVHCLPTPTIKTVEIAKNICTNCIVNHEKHAEIANTSCTICLLQHEIGETITTTNCNHIFHKTCLDTWIAKNRTCPICRTGLKLENMDNFESSSETQNQIMIDYIAMRYLHGMTGIAYSY